MGENGECLKLFENNFDIVKIIFNMDVMLQIEKFIHGENVLYGTVRTVSTVLTKQIRLFKSYSAGLKRKKKNKKNQASPNRKPKICRWRFH